LESEQNHFFVPNRIWVNLSKSLQIFHDSTTHQGTHIWHPSGSMGWCAQGWSYWSPPQNSMSRDPFGLTPPAFFIAKPPAKCHTSIQINTHPNFLLHILYILYHLIIFACSTNFYHVISMVYVNMLFCYSMNRDAGQWSYCDPRFWRIDPVFRLVHLGFYLQRFTLLNSGLCGDEFLIPKYEHIHINIHKL
jgi:hypothetical protein